MRYHPIGSETINYHGSLLYIAKFRQLTVSGNNSIRYCHVWRAIFHHTQTIWSSSYWQITTTYGSSISIKAYHQSIALGFALFSEGYKLSYNLIVSVYFANWSRHLTSSSYCAESVGVLIFVTCSMCKTQRRWWMIRKIVLSLWRLEPWINRLTMWCTMER